MSGYTRSPKLLKGAIIQFSAPMLIPIPNIIIFEYNPETMTRTLTPWAPAERTYDEQGNMRELTREQKNALSQPFDPQDTHDATAPTPCAFVRLVTADVPRSIKRSCLRGLWSHRLRRFAVPAGGTAQQRAGEVQAGHALR